MYKKLLLLALIPLLSGCGQTPDDDHSSSQGSSSTGLTTDTSSETGLTTDTSSTSEYAQANIANFESVFAGGTQFGEGHADKCVELKTYLNEAFVIDGLITNLVCLKVSAALSKEYNDGNNHSNLTIGAASAGGSMEFTFSKSIKKVDILAETYWKEYKPNPESPISISKDTNCSLLVGTSESDVQSFDYAVSDTPVSKTSTREFSGTNKLYLSTPSDHSRMMIQSIKLYF